MKAVVQDLGSGKLTVGDVPPPALQPGGVLVRVRRSLISAGTERAVIALAKQGPIGKARSRPDLARKVINKARQEGFLSTYKVVKNLMASPIPMGYSCAGEVMAVGDAAGEFRVGDRVACAGLNFANHAEVDFVPTNLAVPLPDGVSFEAGSFVALGAIAMHGVRLGEVALGDRVLVMGLGLVGQIAAQLARAAGATVIGVDPDPAKADLARSLGTEFLATDASAVPALLERLTAGHGADAILVCASSKSDEPLRQAAEWVRLKGRVVVVGDVGMQLERRPYFEKEATLVVSRSYGPGRYDPAYEVGGQDYPLAYVRWTERRNMEAFLELLRSGAVRLEPLVTHRFPIDGAEDAYAIVTGERDEPSLAIVLTYDAEREMRTAVPVATAAPRPGEIRLGVIGAGLFAKGVLLPAFAGHRNVRFRSVCTVSGLTSRQVAERYGAALCTSDPAEVIEDPDVHAVVIATRHDQHAALTGRALEAGKCVFLEKPLAIAEPELARLMALAREHPARVFVGFNRRFAPLLGAAKDFLRERGGRLAVTYRVNAGRVPSDSWVLDPAVGGGRIIGEVCHFVDALCYLTDALPARVHAAHVPVDDERSRDRDAVLATITMTDGSVGTVQYVASGDPSVSKEYLEAFGGGRAALLDNYRSLTLHAGNRRRRKRLLNQAKGHAEEVAAFLGAVERGEPMPIPFDTLVAVTQTTFLIHESLETGQAVPYRPPRAGESPDA